MFFFSFMAKSRKEAGVSFSTVLNGHVISCYIDRRSLSGIKSNHIVADFVLSAHIVLLSKESI